MPTLKSVPVADNLASRLRDVRRARRAQTEATEHRPRELVLIAFAVPVITTVACLVIVLAVLLMAGSGLSGVGAAVATCWLAINQTPITVSGVTVGVLPLLPTFLVAGGTVKVVASSGRSRRRLPELVSAGAAAVGGSLLVTAIALAVVMDGSSSLPIQSPSPLKAFALTVLIQGLAAGLGVILGHRDLRDRASAADRRGIRYGVVAVLALFAAGGLFVVLRLVLRFRVLCDLIETGVDFDGHLGLTMLSILYLPNIMIGAAAVLVGSQVHVGPVSADLFAVRGGSVPPLPVLAVLPTESVWWAAFGLVVPAAIAMFVAWKCRSADLAGYARSVGMAAAFAATAMVFFGWLAGGSLGEIGTTGITVVTAGVFTLGWFAAAGVIVALIHNIVPMLRRGSVPVADDDDWLDEMDFDDDYLVEDSDEDYLPEDYDEAAADDELRDDEAWGDEDWDDEDPDDEDPDDEAVLDAESLDGDDEPDDVAADRVPRDTAPRADDRVDAARHRAGPRSDPADEWDEDGDGEWDATTRDLGRSTGDRQAPTQS
ncbi:MULTISPECIES: cell division protein PerM [unclassified Gordonia (in: high G+C Gram-positive bacteria)]